MFPSVVYLAAMLRVQKYVEIPQRHRVRAHMGGIVKMQTTTAQQQPITCATLGKAVCIEARAHIYQGMFDLDDARNERGMKQIFEFYPVVLASWAGQSVESVSQPAGCMV